MDPLDRGSLHAGDRLHMSQYGARRLPFACLGASGLVRTLVDLEDPQAGRTFEVLDASGGYGTACLGADSVVAREWLNETTSGLGYCTDEIAVLERSELLLELFGEGGLWADQFPGDNWHVAGRNSGSEGMELALRLVLESRFDRRHLRYTANRESRDKILAFEGAWHGWTSGLVPLLNRRHFTTGLPALAASEPYGVTIDHIPFGDYDAAREYFARNGGKLLAVVLEPIQGDAGIIEPPAGYLRQLACLTAEYSALLVADEVLTFAKTGRFFAMTDDHGAIPADITVIGKGLGMGVISTSMVIARRELSVRPSGAVATSDLRPLTCALIRRGLRYIVANGLIERAAQTGQALRTLLRTELAGRSPDVFAAVRGQGLMQGVELSQLAADRLPELREHLIRGGAYVEFMAGAGRRSGGLPYVFPTMRLTPPLIATASDLEQIVSRLSAGTTSFLKALS